MMGQIPAILPIDRRYARNHMWMAEHEDGYCLGFSAYAVRLLGDVRHLAWSVEAGDRIKESQRIGTIEASKATSDLYAPCSGEIRRINSDVPQKPSLVNTNLYDDAWLMIVEADNPGLMSPQEYLDYVEAAWPLAQRLLKAQLGKAGQK